MTVLLALALATLALTGAGPTLASPALAWMRPLSIGGNNGYSISVGTTGVYVAGNEQLVRYDFDGNIVWSRQIVFGPFDSVTGVAVGPRGVYVVGRTGDAFVSLYDFDGEMVWTRVLESSSTTTSVSADSAAVYVAGAAEYAGYMFVTKFDSNGNLLWTQRIADRFATAISVGPKAVYVADHTEILSQCHDCPYFTDTFFTAIDFRGNTLWDRKINNETLDVECFCSSTLSVGPTGIYVVDNTVLRTPLGQFADVSLISKYDFGGSELWTKFVSSWRTSPPIMGVSANSKGVYIPGDGFVQHLDPNGNEVWTFNIESQSFQSISTSAKGIFVSGASTIARLCASTSCIHN